MQTWVLIVIIVAGVVIVGLTVLLIISKRMEKKQAESNEMMKKSAQTMSLYIIDKKKMKLKEAGLPKQVYDTTPKLGRIAKVPILKVKIGPKVVNLMCDAEVYKTVLPKQEVRAQVAGIYVMSAVRTRGPVFDEKKAESKGINKFIDKLR